MPIETHNLVIYKSQRLTDTEDGGGKYSGQIVVDGESNNLFPDISELDRTMGDVSMCKIFPGLTNEDTDSLMGATAFISENPADPNVSALLFSTESWTDERASAQNRVENYLAKGAQAVGSLLDAAYMGMKSIQVAMDTSETENNIGDTIILIVGEGTVDETTQFLRITALETRIGLLRVDGKTIQYKIVLYSFNDPLNHDFIGVSATQWYNNTKPATIIRDTIVADSGRYYASVDLVEDVNVGSFTVNAESIYAQLIPSSQVETPLLDLNAVSENTALVAGSDGAITVQFTTNVNTAQSLFLGSGVMPGSMSFSLFGQAIMDSGGTLRTATGTQVGSVDYQTGQIVWTNAIGTGNQVLNITFTPAAAPTQPFESYALPVTQNNQGTNWTGVLLPIPAPGALSISYMAQGKFYVLKDNGTGRLVGANSAVGSGTVNYQTGSWLLTTGALPDVGTPILLQWGSPITTFARSNLAVLPAAIEFDLGQEGVKSGSVTATWLLDGVTKTATSNAQGQFTGDAIGSINYAAGSGKLIPNKLPQKGTVFNFVFDYGEPDSQVVTNVVPDASNKLVFTIGTGAAIQPNSVELDIPLTNPLLQAGGSVLVTDVPVSGTLGNLVDRLGNAMGTINYTTGAVEISPHSTYTRYTKNYTTQSYYLAG
ncbi:hypothetical protein [Acinetobacter tibetensis]|uniref:Uncharacterized protein n=1 Tax=Acinetobacter tibetensis TaxID=2943497 RepID=A0AAE9LP14_9GAMM|nr:hypothetical protein [Acinetobacter tibetensis]USE82023.1 hypothetical protein M5E07_09330 [Acinetobacter tibetensis]